MAIVNYPLFLLMATIVTPLAAIIPGKIGWRVKVRIIRLWCIPDVKNENEPNTIEMVWLDEQTGKIHVTVKKALIAKFRDVLVEGATYFFENLLVGQNDPKFTTTAHKYKLSFIGTTICVRTDAENIPQNHFHFVVFKDILQATKEDKLIDVIGHIVEKDNLKEIEKNGIKKKLIGIVLQDLQGETVHCTLWAEFADMMQQYLDNHELDGPIIVVLQLGKLKKFNGIMGVSNSFFGTKLLPNADIVEVKDYKQRMQDSESQLTQVVSQMSGQTSITLVDEFMQTPRMSIADLYECSHVILTSKLLQANQTKCFGAVYATIIDIETENGWYYDACLKCMRHVSVIGSKNYCDKCKKIVTVVPSFKVQVKVMDDTGSATFMLFDRVVSLYLEKSARDLLAANRKGDVPEVLKTFLNKQLLFKVEVTDAHIYENWQSFAVRKMTGDNEIVQPFISNDRDEQPTNEGQPLSAVELGDSNKVEGVLTDADETPSSKIPGKRMVVTEPDYPVIALAETQASATKLPKMTPDSHAGATKTRKMSRVKTEKMD